MSEPLGFTERSCAVLKGLGDHNHKAWFGANRATFRDALETSVITVLERTSDRLADAPTQLSGSRETMFRINRDRRLSKDKRPHKTQVAGRLTPTGPKTEMVGVRDAQISADG